MYSCCHLIVCLPASDHTPCFSFTASGLGCFSLIFDPCLFDWSALYSGVALCDTFGSPKRMHTHHRSAMIKQLLSEKTDIDGQVETLKDIYIVIVHFSIINKIVKLIHKSFVIFM